MVSRRFAEFDYFDKNKNFIHYGNETAPDIPLKNIDKRIYGIIGDLDELADIEDVQKIRDILKDKFVVKYFPDIGHLGLLWNLKMPHLPYIHAILKNKVEKFSKNNFLN